MNKKAEVSLSLEAILGIVFGIIVVSGLIYGVTRLSNLLPNPNNQEDVKEGDFNLFLKELENILKTKEEKLFNLNLNNNELIFSLGVKDYKLDKSISLKNPESEKIINFNSLIKPNKCKEKEACICNCIISNLETKDNQLLCKEVSDCLNLGKFLDINPNIIISQGSCLEINPDNEIYSTDYYQDNTKKQFTASLKIRNNEANLIISCLNKFS